MCYYYNTCDNLYYHLPRMMPITTFVPRYGLISVPCGYRDCNGILQAYSSLEGYCPFMSAMSYSQIHGRSEGCISFKNAQSQDYRDGLNDLPEADLFRRVWKYASDNGFEGGFPTFNQRDNDYEVVLINSGYGVKQDVRDLPPNPADFTVHMRNVDRNLREDSQQRYLSGFPNFHQSGQLFGVIRLFKNAGERRWVSAAELGFDEKDSNEDRMKKAQNYAARQQGFIGGFPTFEHRAQEFEIILLNKNAGTVRYIQGPPPEMVKLTKTIASFHYPYTLTETRKYRIYLEVTVPKVIADTTQATLDMCMERAKGTAYAIIAPCLTPATMATCPGLVVTALNAATTTFLQCVASDTKIYPYIRSIKVDIRRDSNA